MIVFVERTRVALLIFKSMKASSFLLNLLCVIGFLTKRAADCCYGSRLKIVRGKQANAGAQVSRQAATAANA
jgi:hypothetical protein